jgi:hypothetical protein
MTTYTTGTGQVLNNIHRKKDCRPPCVIHCPTDHVMKDFPTHWRSDRGIMERICPHGVGHPDPDQGLLEEFEWIHGCDGCCMSFKEKIKSIGVHTANLKRDH